MTKRCVVIDPSGLHTILGALDEPLPILIHLPEEVEVTPEAPSGLHMLTFNLIKVKTRFALYRQIQAPPISGSLNDTFNPAQV